MASFPLISQLGPKIGSGGRADVYECDVDGEVIALKIYQSKLCLERELKAYRRLRDSPLVGAHLPQYHGLFEVSQSALSWRPATSKDRRSWPYQIGLGIQRIHGRQLDDIIDDLPVEQCQKLEDDLLATIRCWHGEGVSHGDISGSNILIEQGTARFVILDLSEAVVNEKVSARRWASARGRDTGLIRGIFSEARAVKAANLGLQLLERSCSPPSQTPVDADIANTAQGPCHLDEAAQAQLIDYLKAARGAQLPYYHLVMEVSRAFPSPSPRLGLALARSLRFLGRSGPAHKLLSQLLLSAAGSDLLLLPYFEWEIALLGQAGGALSENVMPHFEKAINGLILQLGPKHVTTLGCRYDGAKQYAKMNNAKRTIEILKDIINIIRREESGSQVAANLLYSCLNEIEALERRQRQLKERDERRRLEKLQLVRPTSPKMVVCSRSQAEREPETIHDSSPAASNGPRRP